MITLPIGVLGTRTIWFEPSHEIMALFVLRKFILQTRISGHPLGLEVWFLVGPFVYFHTLCVRTAKALARLRGCAVSPEPSLFAYAISTITSWAGSFLTWTSWWIFAFYLTLIIIIMIIIIVITFVFGPSVILIVYGFVVFFVVFFVLFLFLEGFFCYEAFRVGPFFVPRSRIFFQSW